MKNRSIPLPAGISPDARSGCLSFVLFLVLGFPFLKIVFHRGRMDLGDVHLLWVLMMAMGGQLLSPVLLAMANRFYAKGDAWTPTWIGVLGLPLAIVCGFFFLIRGESLELLLPLAYIMDSFLLSIFILIIEGIQCTRERPLLLC
jgi:peptidoglycan biosynthesis protein MviN/MurJ (putative lipid II flippase)